jgi:hypothetical protein
MVKHNKKGGQASFKRRIRMWPTKSWYHYQVHYQVQSSA